MQLILTIAGIMAVWTGIKFVYLVFKRLGSRNSMNGLIDRMENGIDEGASKVAGYLKKKKKKDEEQPIVTIR